MFPSPLDGGFSLGNLPCLRDDLIQADTGDIEMTEELTRFVMTIRGRDVEVMILSWEPFQRGDCYPDEGGTGEWILLDPEMGGYDSLTRAEKQKINDDCFSVMEGV